MKRHANTPLTPDLPPKAACRDLIHNIIDSPANDHLLEQLEQQEISSMLDQNTQRGFGVTQMTLADAILPDDFGNFFKMNNLGVQTEIFVKLMFKIFTAFATQKPSIDDQESTFDTSITPIPLFLLKPLAKPFKISSYVKPMLLKSTSPFLPFCNIERLESSDITKPATTNY